MNWKTLLSTDKLMKEEAEPKPFEDYAINEFEKDYNKIVSSAVFRRLQDKTQVFPLEKNDFIRTRLTHSMEVSTIARQLGIMISKNKTQYRPDDIGVEEAEGIASVLLCAGLLHDLGNPPFGHFGETTIGDWFEENLDKIQYKDRTVRECLNEQMYSDLKNFEGNAQALRILLKARYGYDVNISSAIVSSLVKYPTDSCSFSREASDIKNHKLGYYFAERDVFRTLAENMGLVDEQGDICRHPLTYILEAADDIAYATADLEDAFKKRLFTLDEFITFFRNQYRQEDVSSHNRTSSQYAAYYSNEIINNLIERRGEEHTTVGDAKAFHEWIHYVRRWLMYVTAYRFSKSYKDIMGGNYTHDLFYETNHSLTIKILKKAMAEFVFDTDDILKLELSAQSILSFLLNGFVRAILYYDYAEKEKKFIPSKADEKYLAILSEAYKQDYKYAKTGDENVDLYLRLLMVTDYISGMTDTYARTLYRELSGIE